MSAELEHIWSRVQAEVSRTVDEPTFNLWLEPLRVLELTDGHLRVEAPPHARRWIRDRFGRVLAAAVELELGGGVLQTRPPAARPFRPPL